MFSTQLIIGAILISVSVVFHVVALIFLASWVKIAFDRLANLHHITRNVLVMILAVLVILGVHTVEAWTWAIVYLHLGEFDDLQRALYFSVVTSTTLGYGDITLSETWQLLSTFEAMGGLILFGVSTAFLIQVMKVLFGEKQSAQEPGG